MNFYNVILLVLFSISSFLANAGECTWDQEKAAVKERLVSSVFGPAGIVNLHVSFSGASNDGVTWSHYVGFENDTGGRYLGEVFVNRNECRGSGHTISAVDDVQ